MVEHHELVALQPRLKPNVPAYARGEVQTRKASLPLVGRETPHRRYILKPGVPTRIQLALALDHAGPTHVQVSQLELSRTEGTGSQHCWTTDHSAL
jgi:hypothetical protein